MKGEEQGILPERNLNPCSPAVKLAPPHPSLQARGGRMRPEYCFGRWFTECRSAFQVGGGGKGEGGRGGAACSS